MTTDYTQMVATALRLYVGALSATADVGARALRAAARDASGVAGDAAAALRAPPETRGAAIEAVAVSAYDSHRRYLHALRGAGTLWGMEALSRLDAAQEQRQRKP